MENQKNNDYDTQSAQALGNELGQIRKKAGIDIEYVAARLKLTVEQINALEAGKYDVFPGIVFVKGYLRSYARFLKMEEQEIEGRLKTISTLPDDHVYAVDRKNSKGLNYRADEKSGFPGWILGIAAACLVGGGLYAWQEKSKQESEDQAAQESRGVQNSMQTPDLKKDNVSVAAMSESGRQEVSNRDKQASEVEDKAASEPAVKVDSDELWIKVQYRSNLIITDKNGKMVFSRIIPAGSERRFKGGAPYNVWVGIAAGAQANYGGTFIKPEQYRVAGEKSASFVAGKQ